MTTVLTKADNYCGVGVGGALLTSLSGSCSHSMAMVPAGMQASTGRLGEEYLHQPAATLCYNLLDCTCATGCRHGPVNVEKVGTVGRLVGDSTKEVHVGPKHLLKLNHNLSKQTP